jgi:PAS domain S-box-containing protein
MKSESEIKFRNIVNASPMGIHMYRLDNDDKLVFVGANPAADRILKINHEQFIDRTIEDAFPNLVNTEVPSRYRMAAREGISWQTSMIEYRDNHVEGAFEVYAFQTAPGWMAAMFLDVTDRVRADKAQQRQSRLQELLTNIATQYINLPLDAVDSAIRNSLGEMADLVDADRARVSQYDFQKQVARILYQWSRLGLESFTTDFPLLHLAEYPDWNVGAHRRGELIWIPNVDFLPEGSLKALFKQQCVKSILSVPVMSSGECIGFASFHWIKEHSVFSESDQHLLIAFAGMLVNIRRRKQAEEALRDSERHLRSVITAAPIFLWELDNSGRILLSEGNALSRLDTKQGELVGQSVFELNKNDPELIALVRRCLAGEEFSAEIKSQGRDWRNNYAPRRDENGNILGIVVVSEDITDRKKLEEGLRQAQKMEAIGQLAGGVAHDFNNILSATMMRIDLLRENASLDAEAQNALKELDAEARRAANLTRQLLMFSRRSVLSMRVLDLNEVVANLLNMLGRLLGEHITLISERRGKLPLVEADGGMLEQVLLNLAVNARDAMPHGGQITIATEAVEIFADQVAKNPERCPGRFVRLSVSDTGCGMDADTLEKVFEPFFTTKEVGKGTGLGLATVYGIVTQHNGWLEVESIVGHGTTFHIYLPASMMEAVDTDEEESSAIPRGQETLLIVEDNAGLRQITMLGLQALGYRTFEASNGPEAIELWRKHSGEIDLLITDMLMPEGMTGLELAAKIREEDSKFKVIISSGYSAEIIEGNKIADAGIVYLAKPYQISVLGRTVRNCLDRNQTARL